MDLKNYGSNTNWWVMYSHVLAIDLRRLSQSPLWWGLDLGSYLVSPSRSSVLKNNKSRRGRNIHSRGRNVQWVGETSRWRNVQGAKRPVKGAKRQRGERPVTVYYNVLVASPPFLRHTDTKYVSNNNINTLNKIITFTVSIRIYITKCNLTKIVNNYFQNKYTN